MSNFNLDNILLENKILFSTPKFNQTLQEKESLNKNNSLGIDFPSFEEPKFSTDKKIKPFILNKESKEIKINIGPFKENFSISSLINEKNNDDIDNNINDKINNENVNTKINLININMEKPNLKGKKEKALISFGDKSENENTSLNNNEIIYREKTNNSSILSNKEKEKEKENDNNNDNETQKNNDNDNVNNSLEKKTSSNFQNNNNSFQYSLPLENDIEPNINDFFIFDEENNNINSKDGEEKNLKNLDNNPIDSKKEIKIDDNNNNKNSIEQNNNESNKKIITYSKKKAKRSKTERQSIAYKNLPPEKIFNKISEKKLINSEYNDKNNKNFIKNNLLNSCENTKKFKKKIKFNSINISKEENKDVKNNLFLSGKIDSNSKSKNPQKKLTIIKKLKLFNLPKMEEDNFTQVKNYSSRENLKKYKINHDLDLKTINRGRNALNKNIKSEINLNSFYSNTRKFKNLKLTKFLGLFSDFQRFKKIEPKDNFNSINTMRESVNYNNIINSNILNNTNNFNNNAIGKKDNDSKKYNINKNNNKTIMNSNKNNKNTNMDLYHNKRTRNLDNIMFYNSNKIFNKELFNTINYEDLEIKTTETINPIININKNKDNKTVLNNKLKGKIQIKSSVPNVQNSIKKIYKANNNKNLKYEYQYVKNKIINNKNNFQNKIQFKTNKNKNKIDINSNKTSYIFNNQNKAKNQNHQKKFYNKFIYNAFETNPNNDTQKISQISNNKDNININEKATIKNKITQANNFINTNCSANLLQNNRYNKIKVHILYNKHNKLSTSPNLSSQDNISNYWKVYKKPKNTCLINQFSNDYNTISGKKNIIKKNLINNKNKIMEYNSGNKSSKNSKIIALRKRFINNTNLTQKNSISRFYDKSNKLNNNLKGSKRELNIDMNNIYSNMKNSSGLDNYNDEIIRYSIMRNNLNNQVINEFSLTVCDKTNQDIENNFKNEMGKKNDLDINKEKGINKKEGTNTDKKTIINVNQFYPSYFINAQNQNYKEKK